MKFSKQQRIAKNLIEELMNEFGKDRWFTQSELAGITLHTMNALVQKEYLERKYYFERAYYKVRVV